MSIPNLITLGRILLVPVVVWAITAGEMRFAFVLFLAAGISDAVDGFLAKRFGMATELGAYLDPLADKAMLVSIYVALGIADAFGWPAWAGYLTTGALLCASGGLGLVMGRERLRKVHAVPPQTVQSLKENSAWIAKRLSSDRK